MTCTHKAWNWQLDFYWISCFVSQYYYLCVYMNFYDFIMCVMVKHLRNVSSNCSCILFRLYSQWYKTQASPKNSGIDWHTVMSGWRMVLLLLIFLSTVQSWYRSVCQSLLRNTFQTAKHYHYIMDCFTFSNILSDKNALKMCFFYNICT